MDGDLYEFLDNLEAIENVQLIYNVALARRPRIFRERADHFDRYDEKDFFIRYRLSKPNVLFILEKIDHLLEYKDNR